MATSNLVLPVQPIAIQQQQQQQILHCVYYILLLTAHGQEEFATSSCQPDAKQGGERKKRIKEEKRMKKVYTHTIIYTVCMYIIPINNSTTKNFSFEGIYGLVFVSLSPADPEMLNSVFGEKKKDIVD